MLAVHPYPDRLNWVLPDFTRISWTSEAIRLRWEPRLKQLVHLVKKIELQAVVAGVRACALTFVRPDSLQEESLKVAEYGLVAEQIQLHAADASPYANRARSPKTGESSVSRVVIGRASNVERFRAVWLAKDNDEIGALLGYPLCCRQFFLKYWVNQKCIDTTWPMALETVSNRSDNVIEVAGESSTNILWRWIGVRAVPHLPCSFSCVATVQFAEQLRKCADDIGAAEQMGWQDTLLQWPVEWSALHGIAEIKTPILKVTTQTDATARKYVVRWLGSCYPEEAAEGSGFPYRRSARQI